MMELEEYTKAAQHAITRERRRQLNEEGWSLEHDRDQGQQPLYEAARAYMYADITLWPWTPRFWKPTTAVRNMVKAGALAQACIDASPHPHDSYMGKTRDAERLLNRVVLELGKALMDADEIMNPLL